MKHFHAIASVKCGEFHYAKIICFYQSCISKQNDFVTRAQKNWLKEKKLFYVLYRSRR
jgi:hypothetical protein